MSLSTAMFASVSGMDTASTAISVVGDNIANVSTPGFKERRAEFSDVLGQSLSTAGGFAQTGSGARISNVSQIFSQGTFESTARETDLAIEGKGMFVLDTPGGIVYSRAGLFSFDNGGLLTDAAGRRVQGFGIDPLTLQPNGQVGDIQITTAVAPPMATTMLTASVNLDSDEPVIAGGFDPADAFGTSNFALPIDLHDSLGTAHSSTIYFTKTGANAWDWNATLPGALPGDPAIVQGGGALTFDVNGVLQTVTGTTVTYNFPGTGAPNQAIDVDFGPLNSSVGNVTTQFAQQSITNSKSQDGFGPGTLQGIAFGEDGILTANFSNGETRPVAQIVLADFPAIEGLQSIGNGAFLETRDSGQPLVGAPASAQFGGIRSSSIEQSNVDLAAQFIRLILNQRAFQANTRTVSTTNELLANLVQLGQ